MTRNRFRTFAAVLAALPLLGGLTGCVTQGDWDKLYNTNRSLTDANQRLQQERDEARAASELTRQQLVRTEAQLADMKAQYEKALAAAGLSEQALKDLQSRFGSLQLQAVDAETDAALKELAARYPNLIEYIPELGMLRFASDLTFDSGSDEVKSEARQSLTALADILKSGAATAYDVVVVGHTDAQRISANTARRHPTNLHLSAHRAISVIGVLGQMGVPQSRLQAAGWGDQRPAVPNGPSGAEQRNRRVEVFLTKARGSAASSDAGTSSTPTNVSPAVERVPSRQPDITK